MLDLDGGEGTSTRLTLTMRFASEAEKQKHLEQFHAAQGSRELLDRLVQAANA